MLGIKSLLFGETDDNLEITEDQHEDGDAQVGDRRIQVIPRGEIWGYDSDVATGEFVIHRQRYRESGTYKGGYKHYSWRTEDTLFRGTPEEWREIRDQPSKLMRDIPHNWDKIVEHTDRFLEIHEDHLDDPNYPNSILDL